MDTVYRWLTSRPGLLAGAVMGVGGSGLVAEHRWYLSRVLKLCRVLTGVPKMLILRSRPQMDVGQNMSWDSSCLGISMAASTSGSFPPKFNFDITS